MSSRYNSSLYTFEICVMGQPSARSNRSRFMNFARMLRGKCCLHTSSFFNRLQRTHPSGESAFGITGRSMAKVIFFICILVKCSFVNGRGLQSRPFLCLGF